MAPSVFFMMGAIGTKTVVIGMLGPSPKDYGVVSLLLPFVGTVVIQAITRGILSLADIPLGSLCLLISRSV